MTGNWKIDAWGASEKPLKAGIVKELELLAKATGKSCTMKQELALLVKGTKKLRTRKQKTGKAADWK